MAGILIIAHAPLASALLSCACHVYGNELERIHAVDIAPNADPNEMVEKIDLRFRAYIKQNGGIILTDLWGATPANIALKLAKKNDFPLLAGANLSMVLRTIAYRSRPLEVLVQAALAGGSQGVMRIA